jgi:RNA polymerase sigma-70 factor (ECF subfamily)
MPGWQEERELVEDVLQGDEQAARELVTRYKTLIYSTFRRFRQLTREDCDDLFQVFFERLWENDGRRLRQWDGRSLAGYLRTIARNLALDALRARSLPLPPDPIGGEDEGLELPDPHPAPEALAMISELRRMFLSALERLPEPDRMVIQMVDIEGASYDVAAARLGCSRNTAGVRLLRARQRLGVVVREEYPALRAHLEAWV